MAKKDAGANEYICTKKCFVGDRYYRHGQKVTAESLPGKYFERTDGADEKWEEPKKAAPVKLDASKALA